MYIDNGRVHDVGAGEFSRDVWDVRQISQLQQDPSSAAGKRHDVARPYLSKLHQLHCRLHWSLRRYTPRQCLWLVSVVHCHFGALIL